MTRRVTEFDRRLGLRLREARIMCGLTQGELGDSAGVSFQQIQKNERGKSRLSAERLHRIARRLDMPIGFFFDESEASERLHSAEALRLAANIDKLPDAVIAKNLRSLVTAINAAWERRKG